MDIFDIQLDQEALDEANKQINYYSNIPKHIKAMVTQINWPGSYSNSYNSPSSYDFENMDFLKRSFNFR